MLWFQFKPAAEEALSANDYAMLGVFGEPPEQTAKWKAGLSRPGKHALRRRLERRRTQRSALTGFHPRWQAAAAGSVIPAALHSAPVERSQGSTCPLMSWSARQECLNPLVPSAFAHAGALTAALNWYRANLKPEVRRPGGGSNREPGAAVCCA